MTTASRGEEEIPTRAARRAPVILYAASFVLLMSAVGALLLAVRGFLQDLWPLWLSAGLSIGAIAAAIAGLVVARR